MPKYKESRFNEDGRSIRNNEYLNDRECYIDDNGDYLYTTQVRKGKKWKSQVLARIPFEEKCGDTSWTIILDDDDCEIGRIEEKERKLIDQKMQARISSYYDDEKDADGDDFSDPLEEVVYKRYGSVDLLAAISEEDAPEDPIVAKVEEIMKTLTEDQRNLIYEYVGMGKKLEDIRREDEERIGVKKTQQSYSNHWKKICQRFSKELGISLPKKRKSKDTDAPE